MPTPPSNLNPYAAPPMPNGLARDPVGEKLLVVEFDGLHERRHLRNFLRIPLPIGCALTLLIGSGLIWSVVLVAVVGPWASLVVLVLAAAVGYGFMSRYYSDQRLERCQRLRPWLLGNTRGCLSASRLTVWHNDVCVQSNDLALFDPFRRGAIAYVRRGLPLGWVSSACFYEYQWQELEHERRHWRPTPLIIEAPPPNALVHHLSVQRLQFLDGRYHGLRFRASAESLWVALAIGVALMFLVPAQWHVPTYSYFFLPLVLWVLCEGARQAWLRWSFFSQFRAATEDAYPPASQASTSPWTHLSSWISPEAILVSDLYVWMRVPVERIDAVRVDSAGIEFAVGDLRWVLHREGFAGPAAWEQACRLAQSMPISRNPPSDAPAA